MPNDVIYFSWEKMDSIHRKICESIKSDGYEPEVIIGIPRCGMVSAVHMAYILGVQEVGGVYVRTTKSDSIMAEKYIEPIVYNMFPTELIDEKKILLVDTVMASGRSIVYAINALSEFKINDLKTAIVVDWPTSPYSYENISRPNINYCGAIVNKWPDFPWEH